MRLAISPCPNDTFIFESLIRSSFQMEDQVRFLDIAELNQLADSPEAPEVIKVSCASVPQFLERYFLLRCGGAFAQAVGPLVLRKPTSPSARIPERVILPGWRTTAHILFRKWLSDSDLSLPKEEFLRFDQIPLQVANDPSSWGVVIHESRFTYQEHGLQPVVDLGQFWDRSTSTPVPLGCVLVRRDRGRDFASGIAARIVRGLREAFDRSEPLTPFVSAHATEMSPEVQRMHIRTYVTDRSIDCGPDGLDALERLWMAAEAISPWSISASDRKQALREAIDGRE